MRKSKTPYVEPPIQPNKKIIDFMGEKMVERPCVKCKDIHPRSVDMHTRKRSR